MHILYTLQAPLLPTVFLEALLRLSFHYLAFKVSNSSYGNEHILGGTLLTVPLVYESLGFDWATAVLAFITLAMVPFP